jgi:hypothetical protein
MNDHALEQRQFVCDLLPYFLVLVLELQLLSAHVLAEPTEM